MHGERASPAPEQAAAHERDEAFVVMGEVVAPYGVHGWVKVRPYTQAPDALLGHSVWRVRRRQSQWHEVKVAQARMHSGIVLAQFDGTTSPEAAAPLVGSEVGVPRQELPAAADDEIYQADLVGLEVVNVAGVTLGRVVAVNEYGAHPVLRVAGEGVERLIPFVAAHVKQIDLAAGRIDVDWDVDF